MDSPNITWFREVGQGNFDDPGDDYENITFFRCSFHKSPYRITHRYENFPHIRELYLGPLSPLMEYTFDITEN